MDANDNVDDPKAMIAQLFSKRDLINLHHHCYLFLQTPATHKWGSHTINLTAGSPLVAKALVMAWIHPFGDPAMIKGDYHMLGLTINPNILLATLQSQQAPPATTWCE